MVWQGAPDALGDRFRRFDFHVGKIEQPENNFLLGSVSNTVQSKFDYYGFDGDAVRAAAGELWGTNNRLLVVRG